jgi:MinD-like ATPase involved in chromosome partitioning or flagellar assembly
MFLCWSAKGGSGTTVVSAALALVLSHQRPTLLVDLAGDAPAALGLAEPAGPGLADWLASPTAEAAALHRLAVPATDVLRLLPRGSLEIDRGSPRWAELAAALAQPGLATVIDAGTGAPPDALFAAATHRLLVTRPCYLALRRAVAAQRQPTGIMLVGEPGRALGARDVERALNAPVVAELHYDPSVARAVDAGLLAARLPRSLSHALAASLAHAASSAA